MKAILVGFKDFVRQNGVASLAIGVVIGTAVNDLVKNLVEGLIAPLISLMMPGDNLIGYTLQISGATFKIGAVLNAIVTFVAICFIVYLALRWVIRQSSTSESESN